MISGEFNDGTERMPKSDDDQREKCPSKGTEVYITPESECWDLFPAWSLRIAHLLHLQDATQ